MLLATIVFNWMNEVSMSTLKIKNVLFFGGAFTEDDKILSHKIRNKTQEETRAKET